MSSLLPLFPLGTVALPGTSLPLHIFEDRYRDLVGDLMDIEDPAQRLFGVVAIREGYEIGEHSARSMFRVGCLMQLQSAQRYPDGRYDVATVGRGRFRVLDTDTSASYLRAEVTRLEEPAGGEGPELDQAGSAALAAFSAYRTRLEELMGTSGPETPPDDGDPALLSYRLSAATVIPLAEQQRLLETPTTLRRLQEIHRLLRQERSLMRAIPSLPATRIARSGWSPN